MVLRRAVFVDVVADGDVSRSSRSWSLVVCERRGHGLRAPTIACAKVGGTREEGEGGLDSGSRKEEDKMAEPPLRAHVPLREKIVHWTRSLPGWAGEASVAPVIMLESWRIVAPGQGPRQTGGVG